MKNSYLNPKGEGKLPKTLVALIFLVMMGSSAQADNCNQFCTREFWENTSSVQIDTALNDIDPKAQNDYAQTPLHYAASWGTLANVQKLLELGADVNARDQFGQSPIFSAARGGRTDIAKKLLTNKETFVPTVSIIGVDLLQHVQRGFNDAISIVPGLSVPDWDDLLNAILGQVGGKFGEAIRNLKPAWIDNIATDITEGIAEIFEPMTELILGLNESFASIGAFTAVLGDQILSFLQGGLDVFGEIFKKFIESFLDVFIPLIKKGFVPFFKSLFSWFIEPIMIFIFGEDGDGGIYDIIIRYMFYGIIVILFGIFLEILSISKIWAG